MKLLVFIAAILAIASCTRMHSTGFHRNMMDMHKFLRHLDEADEGFPEFDPNEIEGWEEMSAEDQTAIKEFYESMKELAEAFSQLDMELEALNDAIDEPERRRMEEVDEKGEKAQGVIGVKEHLAYLAEPVFTDTIYGQPHPATFVQSPHFAPQIHHAAPAHIPFAPPIRPPTPIVAVEP